MKDPYQIINNLSPGDALAILKSLAASDAQLARRITEIATAQLSQVDPEEVAAVLHEELNALQVEEVWDRAGSPGQADIVAVKTYIEEELGGWGARLVQRHR